MLLLRLLVSGDAQILACDNHPGTCRAAAKACLASAQNVPLRIREDLLLVHKAQQVCAATCRVRWLRC